MGDPETKEPAYHRRVRTVAKRRLTKHLLQLEHVPYPADVERPTTRAQCCEQERPCPFVSCRYHLYLDVKPGGSIRMNFPELEPWELQETCTLDIAERGGVSFSTVADAINVSKQRVEQVQSEALRKLQERRGAPLLPWVDTAGPA